MIPVTLARWQFSITTIYHFFFTLGLFTLHEASFLGIKLEGELNQKAKDFAGKIWIPVVALAVAFLVWTYLKTDILNHPGYDGLIPAINEKLSVPGEGRLVFVLRPKVVSKDKALATTFAKHLPFPLGKMQSALYTKMTPVELRRHFR